MSDVLATQNTPPRLAPQSAHCSQCGGYTNPLALLDSRDGHTYRLFRCAGCDATKWVRDR